MTSIYLIAAVTLIYAGVAGNEAWRGNYPTALVFAGYAFANIGLIMGIK